MPSAAALDTHMYAGLLRLQSAAAPRVPQLLQGAMVPGVALHAVTALLFHRLVLAMAMMIPPPVCTLLWVAPKSTFTMYLGETQVPRRAWAG